MLGISIIMTLTVFSACACFSHRSLVDKLHDHVVTRLSPSLAQASVGTRLADPSLDAFIVRFERIFDRPIYAGCAGDRLFTI